eukprot:9322251-Pyramimonas_sp.AAC.1
MANRTSQVFTAGCDTKGKCDHHHVDVMRWKSCAPAVSSSLAHSSLSSFVRSRMRLLTPVRICARLLILFILSMSIRASSTRCSSVTGGAGSARFGDLDLSLSDDSSCFLRSVAAAAGGGGGEGNFTQGSLTRLQ